MDELKNVLFRQNEIIKKLESTLLNAIKRIENIEKLYFITEKNDCSNNLSPTLHKETKHELFEKGQNKFEVLTNEMSDFDLNAVNSAFRLFSLERLKINYEQPKNKTENMNGPDSHLIGDINGNELSIMNSKVYHSFIKNLDLYQNLDELSVTGLDDISSNNANLSVLETINESENSRSDVFCEDNENDPYTSNNIKFQTFGKGGNELNYYDQGPHSKYTMQEILNGQDPIKMCYNSNKSTLFSNYINKNALNIASSNRLYIFDEEDNSSMLINDPLDLEIAENEFYYLKGQIKRGSTTRDHSRSFSLDNCRHFNCLHPTTGEINENYHYVYKLGNVKNNGFIRLEDRKFSIREIRYHKPFEKIVGYVQIPYNTFLSQSFGSLNIGQIKKCNSPVKEAKYSNSHSIYKDPASSLKKVEAYASDHNLNKKQFTHTNGHYPISYQLLSFQHYPILILRPLISN